MITRAAGQPEVESISAPLLCLVHDKKKRSYTQGSRALHSLTSETGSQTRRPPVSTDDVSKVLLNELLLAKEMQSSFCDQVITGRSIRYAGSSQRWLTFLALPNNASHIRRSSSSSNERQDETAKDRGPNKRERKLDRLTHCAGRGVGCGG